MFADFLSDSPWDNHSRQGWTTLGSFALQALLISALLALPLLYTEGLPQVLLMSPPVVLSPPPGPAPLSPARVAPVSNIHGHVLMMPGRIPRSIGRVDDAGTPPPPLDFGESAVPGGTGTRAVPDSIFGSTGTGTGPTMPRLAPPATPLRVSRMMEGNLIYRVQPAYPPLARQARIQGQVVLRAVISREGAIENLQVLSGHPMLAPAAVEAVRQWRYRPYYLNNSPVEVETQVTVNFVLSGG
jgi:periplasmic protein TonB